MKNSRLTREMWSWASYDFANSAFATSVMTVIFNVYFARAVVPVDGVHVFGLTIPGEALWGYLISATMAATLVLAPPMGAYADRAAKKRALMNTTALIGALATVALFFAKPGHVWFSSLWAFVSILGFEMSLVFYNAFLNDLGTEDERGFLSGLGFAVGYIGGGLCLALNIWMLSNHKLFGLDNGDPTLAPRACTLVAGAWWLVFSIPAMLWVRDRPVTMAASTEVRGTLRVLKDAIIEARRRPDLGRFLISYLIFNDGVQTVLLMASIFGAKALGMSAAAIAACYLMIQFVAFVGALVAGRLADRMGHKKVVGFTIAMFLVAVIWGAGMRTQGEFWALGVLVGLVMGGNQSASRSFYSLLIPEEKAGELFALFSVVGKASSLGGPFVFGLSSQFLGLRPAVAIIGVFFIVGGWILYPMNEERGRAAARSV